MWRHVPSENNPADLVSRGCNASRLKDEAQWWEGPKFLKSREELWPAQKRFGLTKFEDIELKKGQEVAVNVVEITKLGIDQVIEIERFSELGKLVRVTSYVLRFIHAARKRKSGRMRECVEPSAEEMNRAEALWIKNSQICVRKDKRYEQLRNSLGLVEDEKTCHGRIGNAPCPYETKFPALLAKEDPFTKLVIWDSHIKVMHNGARDTLTEIRARFWITQGRQVVNKVISKCVTCKRIEGQRYNSAAPPDLPAFRVSHERAFSRVGVDFAGPVYVRDIYSKNRSLNKAYIALYTCASTRALHLELVPELSTVTFLNCFKRFIGRRGVPKLVVSDNAKTFKSSSGGN